ncbi:MAG: cytochrome P450 [Mesorhizobium sp.]|nr:MAG: cytochrome P450 [Mesorhizobium sp.]
MGELFDPFNLGDDPFPEFARRREAGETALGRPPYPEAGPALYLFSHAAVSKALKHPLLLQAPPGAYQQARQKIATHSAFDLMTKSVMLSDAPQHLKLRRPMASQMTPASAGRIFEGLRTTATELAQAAAQGTGFDAVTDLAVPLSFWTLSKVLGVPIDDPWSIKNETFRMTSALDMRRGSIDPMANDACRKLEAWASKAISDGTVAPHGLVAQMLAEVDAGRWRHEDVIANIVFFLFAGQETVVDAFGNALIALERFTDQRKLVAKRCVDWVSASEELLRYCAPVHYAGARIAARDFDFDGITIRAGQAVVPVLASANRDKAVFPAGDRLDLKSGMSSTLVFGTGLHICLGQHVARLELAALLEALFSRAEGWRLDLSRVVRRDATLLYGLREAPLVPPAGHQAA